MDMPKVKKLKWEDCKPDPVFGITSRADTVFPGEFGTYVIYDDSACEDPELLEDENGSFWFDVFQNYRTLNEAKAAAQADYEARILSALEGWGQDDSI